MYIKMSFEVKYIKPSLQSTSQSQIFISGFQDRKSVLSEVIRVMIVRAGCAAYRAIKDKSIGVYSEGQPISFHWSTQ